MGKYLQLLQSRILIAAVLLFGFTSVSAQYNGLLTVGGLSPDFATIQEACDSLVSQGVNGAVTIAIRSGVYNESVSLDSVPGASATNTIRFRSQNQDSASVTITSGTTTFWAEGPHLIFEDLTLITTNNDEALYLEDGEDWEIRDCHIIADTSSGNSNYAVYIEQNEDSMDIDDVLIINCDIFGYYGVYANNNTGSFDNWMVDNCTIHSVWNDAFYMYADWMLTNLTFQNSTVTCDSGDTGIELYGYYGGMDMMTLSNLTVNAWRYGIYIYSDEFVKNTSLTDVDVLPTGPLYSSNATSSYDAIDIEGYYNQMDQISFDNVTVDAFQYSIYTYSDYHTFNFSFENVTITNAEDYPIYIDGDYGEIRWVDFENVDIDCDGSEGLYMYSNMIRDVNFENVDIYNDDDEALYIDGYIDVRNININNCYFESDDGDAAYIEAQYYSNIADLTITNSTFDGDDYGLYLYTYSSIPRLTMTNNDFYGYYDDAFYAYMSYGDFAWAHVDSCYFYSEYDEGFYADCDGDGRIYNMTLQNSTIETPDDYGVYLAAYTGMDTIRLLNLDIDAYDEAIYVDNGYNGLNTFWIMNCDIYSDDNDAIFMESDDGGGDGLYIKHNSIDAYDSGIYLDAWDYGLKTNWEIDSNDIVSDDYGIYIEGDYGGWSHIYIRGNTIDNDYMYNEAIYLEADDSDLRWVEISDNWMCSGYGIYLEADYGGIHDTRVADNEIYLSYDSGDGIYVDQAGAHITIENNVIDTCDGNTYYDEAIYIDGDYMITDSLWIIGNDCRNFEYGIYAEYSLYNVQVKNNYFQSTPGGDEGIYLYECFGDELVVDGNEVYGMETYDDGMYIEYVSLSPGMKAQVTNNMISGYERAYYFDAVDDLIFAHNTIFDDMSNDDIVYFDWSCARLEICNNLINVDSANFGNYIWYFYENHPVDKMDNNVVNHSSANGDYAYNDYWGTTFNSMSDWTSQTGFDANSFDYEATFANDTNNLRLSCGEAVLREGKPGIIGYDIDMNPRAAPKPTIGADELTISGNLFMSDNETVCDEPVTLDAGYAEGASYSWSPSGATTQMIMVSQPGTHVVTVTTVCNTQKDTVTVSWESVPSAAFTKVKSFATVTFTNTSSDATSYAWDFGDGNTSTMENPQHIYAGDGVYTVTLIAYGECTNDTTQQSVTINTAVGMYGDADGGAIAVYPNPTTDVINVGMEGFNGNAFSIKIMNLNGQTVLSREVQAFGQLQVEEFDLSGQAVGVYFVRVVGEGVSKTSKIVLK